MLRARSGIRRLRPGVGPLSISQPGRLLRPPSHALPPPALAALVFQRQPDRALTTYGRSKRGLGSDPLATIAAVVEYGSEGQVRSEYCMIGWWSGAIWRLAASASGNCNSLLINIRD